MENTLAPAPPAPPPDLPSPKGARILGHIPRFLKEPLVLLDECLATGGDVIRLRLGLPAFLFNRHDLVEEVLHDSSRFAKSFSYMRIKRLTGESILTTQGVLWKAHQKAAKPAFHKNRLSELVGTITKTTEDCLDRLGDAEGPVDLHKEMMGMALRILGRALLGVDLKEDIAAVGGALSDALEVLNVQVKSPLLMPMWFPTPGNLRLKRSVRTLDRVSRRIIEERRGDGAERGDLLAMLMDAAKPDGTGLSEQELLDEVRTFLLAGHETTANALAWTWYLLGSHPEVMARVRSEVETVLSGRAPTFEELMMRLPYVRAAFDEAMRLYPPAWAIERMAAEATAVGGVPIPKHATILVSPYALHRNPAYWHGPVAAFDPERFYDKTIRERRPKSAYFPFGGGQHRCIGDQFAILEGMLIIVMMIQRFRIELVPGQRIEAVPTITLRPKPGVMARLRPL